MKNKRLLLIVGFILAVSAICGLIYKTSVILKNVNSTTNFEVESLRWSIIGAIGSWAGSIFGAIALMISMLAFLLPQKVKIKVEASTGFMLSQTPGVDRIDVYIVTVKNVGVKPISITNLYLHFGSPKKNRDIFIGAINLDSLLQAFTPKFPVRLDQGESFSYYLLKDKLDHALYKLEKAPIDSPLYIRIDEVITGSKYFKTKLTLKTFTGHLCKQDDKRK